jgi:ABC-2 type transport system ATP-binding protein
MHETEPALEVVGLSHWYGARQALRQLTFSVDAGEIFAFLGPNGGGKTTLFRVLSTLVPPQEGKATILGHDLRTGVREVRRRIGVVFQAPSLDKKLTVAENIRQQAALYGVPRPLLRQRERELLQQLGLAERRGELTERLSGGLRRRAELAKGMIHRPSMLLLDEPSTGLDPGARSDLWEYLCRLRDQFGVTVVLTTHLLDEADRADRVAILSHGELVALDTPDALRSTVGGESITIETSAPNALRQLISDRFSVPVAVVDGRVRLEQRDAARWVARLMEAFADRIDSIMLGKPSLEDVFIARTGHRFWDYEEPQPDD